MKKEYTILANPYGEEIETVSITGDDEQEILEQLDAYLDRKQNCYAEEEVEVEEQ